MVDGMLVSGGLFGVKTFLRDAIKLQVVLGRVKLFVNADHCEHSGSVELLLKNRGRPLTIERLRILRDNYAPEDITDYKPKRLETGHTLKFSVSNYHMSGYGYRHDKVLLQIEAEGYPYPFIRRISDKILDELDPYLMAYFKPLHENKDADDVLMKNEYERLLDELDEQRKEGIY